MRKLEAGRLVIASHNEGKVREIRVLLGPYGIEPVSAAELDLPEPDEIGTTFIDNADLKARAAADLSGLPALADDSGLCVEALGERQVTLDCDVIQADGGTRTAAISGAWVALKIAVDGLLAKQAITADPIRQKVAAVSCGIHQGNAVLDLDYAEDSAAGCDGNFVLTDDGKLVEAQLTAEGECFDEEGLLRLLRLARIGCAEIFAAQDAAVREAAAR